MKKELFEGLNEEQIAKAKTCKNNEELLKLAKEEGIELNDEQLAVVNGGFCSDTTVTSNCPNCGTKVSKEVYNDSCCQVVAEFKCPKCGHKWTQRFNK